MGTKKTNTQYSADQIIVKNIPKLYHHQGQCYRSYLYRFSNPIPKQHDLDKIAQRLQKKFRFPKEKYELTEDIEVELSVLIKRITDYKAEVSVVTDIPEEDCVYI